MPRTLIHEVGGLVPQESTTIPKARWSALVAVAVGGSLLYGASLSLVLPDWNAGTAALWFAVSAGLAWCVFIPALRFSTGLSWLQCADASLVTMAFGEVVLGSGALVNGLLWQWEANFNAGDINCFIVLISNLVMGGALSLMLLSRGVAVSHSLTMWMLALNGSGAVFFFIFHRLLLAS